MSSICRLCGSTDATKRYTIEPYSVLECRSCGFVYTSPLEASESVYSLYKHRYFSSSGEHGYRDYEKDKRVRTATFSYYFQLLQPYLSGKKSVLDAGCSDGSFLDITSKNGFEQNEGIELNEEMFTITSKKFRVYDQPLEKFSSETKYDLITLFDVLEHIPELQAACKKLAELSADNGLLVLLTPDYGSFSRKLYGSKWFQFKPPEHINYFTKERLVQLLSENGFETVLAEKGVSLVDHVFIDDRLRRYGHPVLRFFFSVFGRLFFAGRPFIKLSNSAIFLIAKRVR